MGEKDKSNDPVAQPLGRPTGTRTPTEGTRILCAAITPWAYQPNPSNAKPMATGDRRQSRKQADATRGARATGSSGRLLLLPELAIEARAVNFTHFLPTVVHSHLERLLLAILLDGEGRALLDAGLRPPAHGVALVFRPVGPYFCGPRDAEFPRLVPRVRDDDAALPFFFRYFAQLLYELVAVFAGHALRLAFATAFAVAEELGVGLTIAVTANEPTVGRSGIDTADAFVCFFSCHGCCLGSGPDLGNMK